MRPTLGHSADGRPARVLALFGPTAVGKTAVARAVAERLGGRVALVSADALQVYRGLEVLTGAADLPGLRLTSFVDVTGECSAGAYARLAHAEVDAALHRGDAPVVVGGTGLYLRAALAELDLRPPPPPGLREGLVREAREHGIEALHERLRLVAPAVARAIAPRDTSRVVRALELHAMGELREDRGELWTTATRHPTRLVGLTMAREELHARIEARVGAMVAAGAAEEVRRAAALGAGPSVRKAVGFEELLRGDVDAMVTRTRRYARRQLTWMRKLRGAELVDVTGREAADVAAELLPDVLA